MTTVNELWNASVSEAAHKQKKTKLSKDTRAIRMNISKKSHKRSNPRGSVSQRIFMTHCGYLMKDILKDMKHYDN